MGIINKDNYILINMILVFFWVGMTLLSPSFLIPLKEERMILNDATIRFNDGRLSGIEIKLNDDKYYIYCRDLRDINKKKFCQYASSINKANVELVVILPRLYKKVHSIAVLKKMEWHINGQKNYFMIDKISYDKSVNYIKYSQYIKRILMPLSFVLVLVLYKLDIRNILKKIN